VADANDVARWMCEVLSKRGYLEQAYAVLEIEQQFGSAFVYLNRNENPAIARSVLNAFRNLCGDDVVWEKSGRNWRLREPGDPSGRQVK
jgi:hypothetical protein